MFDYIHDYYGYLNKYFSKPHETFVKNDDRGYSLCIWNIYLQERFGYEILKRQWELHRQYDPLNSIEISLAEYGTSFINELNRFGIWTYFTNYRTQEGKYFKDAANYPLISATYSADFTPPQDAVSGSQELLSNNFFRFICKRDDGFTDTLCSIITNGDIQACRKSPDLLESFEYSLYNYNAAGSSALSDGFYSKFYSGSAEYFKKTNIFNNQLTDSGYYSVTGLANAYPAPFNYGRNNNIYFPVIFNPAKFANLTVYSISMGKIFNDRLPIGIRNNKFELKWNGLDNNGKKLAAGVYIFVTDSDGGLKKGKLAVIN